MIRNNIAGYEKVVDLCGGSGHVAYHLLQKWGGLKIDNVDLNQSALDICSQMNSNKVGCFQKSCYNSGLKSKSYDIAICWLSFFHLSNPKQLIKEMNNLLRKGGYGIISTYLNIDHDIDILATLKENLDKNTEESTKEIYTANELLENLHETIMVKIVLILFFIRLK